MTNVEKDAEWIKAQRKAIAKAINEVVTIVTYENLEAHYRPEYTINFEQHMSGNCFSINIYKMGDDSFTDKHEFWLMDSVFEYASPFYSKQRVEIEVTKILDAAKIMKQKALYYSKLNRKK
jgi:hypothetical protein